MESANHRSAWSLLEGDFRRTCEYIEPADSNSSCYSHRLYELLLRASTEFESACKEYIKAAQIDAAKLRKPGDGAFAELAGAPINVWTEVQLTTWSPSSRWWRPFEGWTKSPRELTWYGAYNIVKHNRVAEFPRASLTNVVEAMGGLFLTLMATRLLKVRPYIDPTCAPSRDGGWVELTGEDVLFNIRYPGRAAA
jgi:hypothetical protein